MMGVRASMPGDGDHTEMYVRFAAQFYDRGKQLWRDVSGSAVSRWIKLKSGKKGVPAGDLARLEAGYTFAFDAPSNGKVFRLRGAVDYKWVKCRRIVRSAHQTTKGGHPYTKGSDPKGYSAGLCEIT
jgi:hypothetical protein